MFLSFMQAVHLSIPFLRLLSVLRRRDAAVGVKFPAEIEHIREA